MVACKGYGGSIPTNKTIVNWVSVDTSLMSEYKTQCCRNNHYKNFKYKHQINSIMKETGLVSSFDVHGC